MTDPALLSRRFRRSSDYRMVPLTALTGEQASAYGSLGQDPSIFGILLPEGPGATVKAVDRDVALLWLTLSEAGPLPPLPADTPPGDIGRLVVDGILEVEAAGTFVTGPAAGDLAGLPAGADDAVDAASYEALRYGSLLPIDEPAPLSARLYFHGRIPAGPGWRTRLPDPAAVAAFLGLSSRDRLGRSIRRSFQRRAPGSDGDAWATFARRAEDGEPERPSARHKVYVCVQPGDVPAVLADVLEIAEGVGVDQWKVAASLQTLLRPDKLVLYADSPSRADAVAAELAAAPNVSAAMAQPLAFVRRADDDGRVAVGIDPPRTEQKLVWMERESWRLWVTNRLAAGLVHARRSGARERAAISFALDRLRLDGVDPRTWAPLDGREETLWN